MAEAFALSPISARAQLPSEADYDAIRDAFMETMRGRWFLAEYAKRNRNVDTTMVLDAVARLEAGIAARTPATPSPAEIIAAIRPLIAEARADAAAAMVAPETDNKIAAGRRGARIIREISWSLRETGTDPRICNILDQQLLALETLHGHLAGDTRGEQIGEVFDDLVLRIESIASNGTVSSRKPTPEPVETVGANVDIASVTVAPMMDATLEDSDSVAAPSAGDTADDEAMLDLIAIEMAAPHDEDGLDHAATAGFDSLAEPDAPMSTITPPASEAPPLQPSLGAALLAGGIVRAERSRGDALAPFRRMSQIEKIAFFS